MMPSAYRKSYIKIIRNIYDKEKEEYDKLNGKQTGKIT
jgi:hypothetical protein